MDIDRVRYFHVFADTGSLVRASEVLHISQPALSKALRLLESEIGIKLVETDGRGLKLSEAGKTFRSETSTLLDSWLKIPEKIKSSEKWTPTKIGSFEVFTTYFLGHMSDSINLESLEVHELGPGKLEAAIATGQVDIGITYVPVPKVGVEFVEVAKISMGVFGISKIFANVDFSDLPFVIPLLPSEGTPSKVIGLDGWPDHRFERKVKFRVTMMGSALELCRKGLGVAYLPRFIVDLYNKSVQSEFRLSEFKSPIPTKERSQSVFIIYKKGSAETGLHRKVAKCLRLLS